MNNLKKKWIVTGMCILLILMPGCSDIKTEEKNNQYYESVDDILEMFQKNRLLFEEVARLLIGNDEFWDNLRLQSAGKSLDIKNMKHAKVYEGYFSEDEWNRIKELFLYTNANNFNRKRGRFGGYDPPELTYIVFTYVYIAPKHLVQFNYVERTNGGAACANALPGKYGVITQLDDYWYYEVWDVGPD